MIVNFALRLRAFVVAMAGAFREGLAMLHDRGFDFLGEVSGDHGDTFWPVTVSEGLRRQYQRRQMAPRGMPGSPSNRADYSVVNSGRYWTRTSDLVRVKHAL